MTVKQLNKELLKGLKKLESELTNIINEDINEELEWDFEWDLFETGGGIDGKGNSYLVYCTITSEDCEFYGNIGKISDHQKKSVGRGGSEFQYKTFGDILNGIRYVGFENELDYILKNIDITDILI